MDVYPITLYVSLEQELAIRELFVARQWHLRKKESYCGVDESKLDDISYNSSSKVCRRSSESPEPDRDIPPDNQIFSDLQDFVKATLEANDEEISVCFSNDDFKVPGVPSFNPTLDTECNSTDKIVNEKENSIEETDPLTSEEYSNRKDLNGRNAVNKPKKKIDGKCVGGLSKRNMKKRGFFKCDDCNCTFKLLGAFNNHKRNGQCLFVCEHCGKKFTSRYYCNYIIHLKYHSNERGHTCKICGKSYIEAHTLKQHMRKHSGIKSFICDSCGKSFCLSSQLTAHKNTTHRERTEIFKCDVCDQILSTSGNLRVHKRVVHSLDRPFTCELCGKTFKTHKALNVHCKVHGQSFPFKCNFPDCLKTFKRPESLADHLRRHRNERTHFCDQCGKGFYTNKDLQLHVRVHTGEKPFNCDICGYKCALAGNLKKHMKTHQTGI